MPLLASTVIFEAVFDRCTATGKVKSALVVIFAPSLMMPLVVKVNAPIGVPDVPIGLFKTICPDPDDRDNAFDPGEEVHDAPARVITPLLELSATDAGVCVTAPVILMAPPAVVMLPLEPEKLIAEAL